MPQVCRMVFLLSAGTIFAQQVAFRDTGRTPWGNWSAEAVGSPRHWAPGDEVTVAATLTFPDAALTGLAELRIKPDAFVALVTAERTFDATGWQRFGGQERMSTLLTPTGLPIEGGISGAVTNRFGYGFRTPLDLFVSTPLSAARVADGHYTVRFEAREKLPDNLPPGIYRLRIDYGVAVAKRNYNLAGESFARKSFSPIDSHHFSPLIPSRGQAPDGSAIDGRRIVPRVAWVLLGNYNSNGYRGVVADEDSHRFGISGRNLIQDDIILPRFDDNKRPLSYSLEPQVLTDTIETRNGIPWEPTRGELSVFVEGPNGYSVDLGKWPYVAKSGSWPTTRRSTITAWRPPSYGRYTVRATGWMEDIHGTRYHGGGTYRFWIAKRMTMATATFQGMSYPVGNRYGRDIGFAPAVPADVTVTATLFPYSDVKQARTVVSSGKASPSGVFGAAQGMKPLPFDAPGEYMGHVLATYTDGDGHLWVCSMRHAGVVYPADSPIVARGKKLYTGGKYYDRGSTGTEGYMDPFTGKAQLVHINYPWQAGDVLLIASEGYSANKIEPVLTWEARENPKPWDPTLNTIGATNLRIRTSNGYSPHMFPEYITEWMYYYAGAPRPGFMSRFLVAEDGARAPYWHLSPNSFGGQINATAYGDMPGDIYRLIGGVVIRRADETPQYAGYIASAFILPRNSRNNRIVAPGSEDLPGSDGSRSRVFLVGTRPGMLYETGTSFAPALQIDPILPVEITFTLHYPDGRTMVARGKGDQFGSFAGSERWTLDVPGLYRFTIDGTWEGHKARMPGLPAEGGVLYVIEKDRPATAGMQLDLPEESSFNVTAGATIGGRSTASTVHYAAVMPGAVLEQGELPVTDGKFELRLDPVALNLKAPTYEVENPVTQRPEIKDVIHLTFFSRESGPDGKPFHSFVRLILRGNRILYTR